MHVPSGASSSCRSSQKREKTLSTNCANVSSKREADLSILFSFQELVVYLPFHHTCVSQRCCQIIEAARNPTANYANLSSWDGNQIDSNCRFAVHVNCQCQWQCSAICSTFIIRPRQCDPSSHFFATFWLCSYYQNWLLDCCSIITFYLHGHLVS